MRRKKGAQPGNRNAMKHGLYSKVLDHSDKLELKHAASVEGLDAEIALLRLKITRLIERDPDNLDLFLQASSTLAKLVRVKDMGPQQANGLDRAIGNVLREVASTLGLKIVEKSPANYEEGPAFDDAARHPESN